MSKRIVRPGGVGAVVALVAMLLLVGSPVAGAASAKSVSVDRWIRGVCRETADWMEARNGVSTQVATVTADLTAGELKGKAAAKQLGAAYADASTDTKQAISAIRGAGTPKIAGGKAISGNYQARLAEYQDAYDKARESITRATTSDGAQLATSANEVATTLASDLGVLGGDPLEELRGEVTLADGIAASCTDVDQHLGATVDAAGCRAALSTAHEYTDLNEKLLAAAEGTPEQTALGDQLYALVTRWRTEVGGCNTAAVLGPCRLPLETSQAVVKAAADYDATPEGSPEEQTASDAWVRADTELATQLPKCTA